MYIKNTKRDRDYVYKIIEFIFIHLCFMLALCFSENIGIGTFTSILSVFCSYTFAIYICAALSLVFCMTRILY